MTKYLKESSEEDKKLLLYFLRFIDSAVKEVHAEGNTFVAYCSDEERGDMIIQIDCMKPVTEEDRAKNTSSNGTDN